MAKYEITSISETLQKSTKKPNGFYKVSIGGSKGYFYVYKSDDGYWAIDYDGTKSYLTENAIIVANKLQSNLHNGKSLLDGIVYDNGIYTTKENFNLGVNDTLISSKSTNSPSESNTSKESSASGGGYEEPKVGETFLQKDNSEYAKEREELFYEIQRSPFGRFLYWFFGEF